MTTDNPEPETTVPDESPVNRRLDAELQKMNAILRILNDLPAPSQTRVMRYLADRFAERDQPY